jgi:hypothetical protein
VGVRVSGSPFPVGSKPRWAAVEAVAKHFSATWENGEQPPDAYIKIGKKKIAVDIAAIKRRMIKWDGLAKPRLRFDKAVLRLIGRLQSCLHQAVPDGKTLIVTVTAPILLPGKTAATLEDKIRGSLAHRSAGLEIKDMIHGNQVRVRLAKSFRGTSKVIGFVHNPDSDPEVLFGVTDLLLKYIGADADKRRPAGFAGDRWLVIVYEGEPVQLDTYRLVCSQISLPADLKKVLIVPAGGLVESLSD